MGKSRISPKDIALLTDFGSSHYSGILHAVIRDYNPEAHIIDLTHNISPFNIVEASFVLLSSYTYFRKGTVFVAVVDPGVGTQRRIIFGEKEDYHFVAPDNGLLSPFLNKGTFYEFKAFNMLKRAVSSSTFHGRDIFAPIGALITLGTPLSELGEPLNNPVSKPWWETPILDEYTYQGIILHIDRFGNAVTNISCKKLPVLKEIRIKGIIIKTKSSTFERSEYNTPFIYCGSSGFIEIGVKEKSFSKEYTIPPLTPLLFETE